MIMIVEDRITEAVNAFNAGYHADYFVVRNLANEYLSTPPLRKTVMPLAVSLNKILSRWGAGRRGAPKCKLDEDIASALSDDAFHAQLAYLYDCTRHLQIDRGRRVISNCATFDDVNDFDGCLIEVLAILSEGMFVGNTNVTYPMKSLLLLTGLLPAFDSQVKGGLSNAGVSGINKTRYLLPQADSNDAKKICCMPFYIADCVNRDGEIIEDAIRRSMYPSLAGQYGRIFDVLFFMQNSGQHLSVKFHPPVGLKWYEI